MSRPRVNTADPPVVFPKRFVAPHRYSGLRRHVDHLVSLKRRLVVGAPAVVVLHAADRLRGAPRGRIGELIEELTGSSATIVSLDTPSGLDVTEGSSPGAAVAAAATLTLALPKVGLRSASEVGDLYCGDISVPPSVYERIGVDPAPDFSVSQILRVVR